VVGWKCLKQGKNALRNYPTRRIRHCAGCPPKSARLDAAPSIALQKVNLDILSCAQEVSVALQVLQGWRADVEAIFDRIFETAESLTGEISMPRICSSQRHRTNIPATTAKDYYRATTMIPFLDNIISQFQERFSDHRSTAFLLAGLIPILVEKYNFNNLKPALDFYKAFISEGQAVLEGEYDRWRFKWISVPLSSRPSNALDAFLACDVVFFPCISSLLQIFATLPVTSATAERSFSALKYLKNYHRTTMNEERLNGLALMFIHRDVEISVDRVIDKFCRKNRNVTFC